MRVGTLAFLGALLASVPAFAASTHPAADVAFLVDDELDDAFAAKWDAAIHSDAALTRATAARLATVRDYKSALPALRAQLGKETDPVAQREVLRAVMLFGDETDVDPALAVATPETIDALIDGIARHGGAFAVNAYLTKLRKLPIDISGFFTRALWQREGLVPQLADRLLIVNDDRGWSSLLGTLGDSDAALPAPAAVRAMQSNSEAIRVATVWYLAHGYAANPSLLPQPVRPLITNDPGPQSDREAFGRELLRRMLGGEMKDDDRWLRWLATPEADALLKRRSEISAFFSVEETKLREARCAKLVDLVCTFVPKSNRTIPSQAVRQADFQLPTTLPRGLASDILAARRCTAPWLGIATATVDFAGRVQTLDLRNVNTACFAELNAISRLSLVDNASMRTPLSASGILFVRAQGVTPCLDELPRSAAGPRRVGDDVRAPVVTKRVEPRFPANARRKMGANRDVRVIIECVITREGCIRSIRLLTQSPYPDLNAAAVLAASEWMFDPGRLDGKPVDVIFNLTIRFVVP